MGDMWAVLIAVAACLVVVAVAVAARRSGHDELHSVRTYHAALGTIERLPARAASADPAQHRPGPVRGSNEDADPSVRPITTDAGRASERPAVPPARLLFDDASPVETLGAAPGAGVPLHRERRSERQALASMNHRPRQGGVVFVVVVLVILAGALAYLGTRHSGHTAALATGSSATSATRPPARGHGSTSRGNKKKQTKHTKHPSAPPTPPTRLVATTATTTTATYSVITSPFTVTVTASQPCWVEAIELPGGATLWTGTLAAGGSQSIPASGLTTVELGAPGASVTVNGVPVIFPTSSHTPFTATFQPAT